VWNQQADRRPICDGARIQNQARTKLPGSIFIAISSASHQLPREAARGAAAIPLKADVAIAPGRGS